MVCLSSQCISFSVTKVDITSYRLVQIYQINSIECHLVVRNKKMLTIVLVLVDSLLINKQ